MTFQQLLRKLTPWIFSVFMVCVSSYSWQIRNIPKILQTHISDHFVAGQLMQSEFSQEYINSSPIYKKQLAPYRQNCNWGYYFKIDANSHSPTFGIVIQF